MIVSEFSKSILNWILSQIYFNMKLGITTLAIWDIWMNQLVC